MSPRRSEPVDDEERDEDGRLLGGEARWREAEEARQDQLQDEYERAMEALEGRGELPDNDDPMQERAIEIEIEKARKIREEEAAFPPPSRVWLEADRMTQTESSLRVSFHLIGAQHVTSDVEVAISGDELTRGRRPKFPVVAYLAENGWYPEVQSREWRTIYRKAGVPHALKLSSKRGDWRVVADVAPGARVLVCTVGGTLSETRGQSEHGPLRTVIQTAMVQRGVGEDDLVLAVVPRSKRSRLVVERMAENVQIKRARLNLCTVDRSGGMTGLPFPGC